ncbi:hypothetical protein Tco_1539948 [Tanacetum coccineum]
MNKNIMAAGSRDRPPMLAPGRYAQWQSRVLRYVDTKPNGEALRKCILQACSFMLCDLDFEPLSLSLSSLPSCNLVSLTNILILCLILKASNQSLRKSLSLNLELS